MKKNDCDDDDDDDINLVVAEDKVGNDNVHQSWQKNLVHLFL